MAKRTYVQIYDRVEEFLQDSGNAVFLQAEIESMMTDVLYRIANYKLVITRHSLTTIASKELQIATITDLIDPLYAEYTVDKNPRNFRNIIRRGNTVELDIHIIPTAAETVYLYCKKPHRINQMTDLAGAIDLTAGYSKGDTTIHVDDLQATATIPIDTEFTIAGIGGVYRLTAAATIASNEGDLTFFPGLVAAAADGVVVTFEQSTLDPILEDLFINYVAARVAVSKSSKYLQQINTALTAMTATNTALDKVATEVLQAIADLDSGRTLINAVNVGGKPQTEYVNYAVSGVGNAQGYISEANGYINEVVAELNMARSGSRTTLEWGKALERETISELKKLQEQPEHFWQEYPKD